MFALYPTLKNEPKRDEKNQGKNIYIFLNKIFLFRTSGYHYANQN